MEKLLASVQKFRPSDLFAHIREFRPDNLIGQIREFDTPANRKIAFASTAGIFSIFYLYRRYKASIYLPSAGKAVFITGCDSGFGKAAALAFHERGYVVFAGCLDAKKAEESTFADLVNQPEKTFYIIQLDVTNQGQIDSAAKFVEDWLRSNPDHRLWCLLNNAGISSFGPVEFVSMKTFERVMECNFFGSVRVTKAILPLIRQKPGGRVIFLGSIGGHLPCPSTASYGCTKAANLFFADTLSMELDGFGIRVSVIMPDFYRTNIMEPNQSLATFNREIDQTDKTTLEAYGGEPFMDRLRKFLTVVSPPRAKDDLSPVVNAIIHAASSKKPRRRYYPMEISTKIATIIFDFAPLAYLAIMKNFI